MASLRLGQENALIAGRDLNGDGRIIPRERASRRETKRVDSAAPTMTNLQNINDIPSAVQARAVSLFQGH